MSQRTWTTVIRSHGPWLSLTRACVGQSGTIMTDPSEPVRPTSVGQPRQDSGRFLRISARLSTGVHSRVPQPVRRSTHRDDADRHPFIPALKKILNSTPNSPRTAPDDVFGGQPPRGLLGGGFSKILDPTYRLSLRPLAEVFAFLEPPLPIPCQPHPGERGSSRVVERIDSAGAPSSRERRTGPERWERLPLSRNNPKKQPPGPEEVRKLHTRFRREAIRGLDGRFPPSATVVPRTEPFPYPSEVRCAGIPDGPPGTATVRPEAPTRSDYRKGCLARSHVLGPS
jgi:hypothetical protein